MGARAVGTGRRDRGAPAGRAHHATGRRRVPELAGARISGRIGLPGAQIAHALWLDGCWFEESVDLLGASLRTLVITGSRVPGIEADSARIEGILDLRGSVVESLASWSWKRVCSATAGSCHWSNDGLQCLAYALIALGWVLTTSGIAGVTRALQKD